MQPAFLFPGQGAQHVGMGRDLCEASPAARRVFQLAEEACALPLRKLSFEGLLVEWIGERMKAQREQALRRSRH